MTVFTLMNPCTAYSNVRDRNQEGRMNQLLLKKINQTTSYCFFKMVVLNTSIRHAQLDGICDGDTCHTGGNSVVTHPVTHPDAFYAQKV